MINFEFPLISEESLQKSSKSLFCPLSGTLGILYCCLIQSLTLALPRGESLMSDIALILKNIRQHLMTGVSYMIPFVVSGGILLAVSVMLYGKGGGQIQIPLPI